MQEAAEEALKTFIDDPMYKLYRAIALIMNRKINDALRELEPLQVHFTTS